MNDTNLYTLYSNHRPRALTSRRVAILDRVYHFVREHGYSPTIREITSGLNLKSHSSVHSHLNSLVRDGFLCRSKRSVRPWELTAKALRVLNVSRCHAA